MACGRTPDSSERPRIRKSCDWNRAIFAASYAWDGSIWEVSPSGTRRLYDLRDADACDPKEIAIIASDLQIVTTIRPVLRIEEARVSKSEPKDGHKEDYLHTRQNIPQKDLPVGKLRFARTLKPGTAYAHFENQGYGDDRDHRLGVFKNGLWYETGKLTRKLPNDVWLGQEAGEPFVVLVGQEGWVYSKVKFGESGIEKTLPVAADATSGNMVRVWGVSPHKFWVMDDSGTVWELSGAESRVVVRGLKQEGTRFHDAWVSPSGNVYALTPQSIYRLK